jgi:hypothetical protein
MTFGLSFDCCMTYYSTFGLYYYKSVLSFWGYDTGQHLQEQETINERR